MRDQETFDWEHQAALSRIWFLGDVHGRFDHVERALHQRIQPSPTWLVFLGDIQLENQTFEKALAPIRALDPELRIGFVHGNHDADQHEYWSNLHDGADATALHGRVVEMDGVRVAGLGGNFMGRVWTPPSQPSFGTRREATKRPRDQLCAPALNGAIYPDELARLARQRADLLVTHEAFSCHLFGWPALDQLARNLGVLRAFHGHTHDDLSQAYQAHRDRMGFDVHAVNYCCIKNGLGQRVFESVHLP